MNKLEGHSADLELLGKYLAGECNPRELAEVEEWLRDPANAAELETFRTFWEGSGFEAATVDTEAAWDKVKSRMGTPLISLPRRKQSTKMPYWWAAAALLIVGIGIGLLVFRGDETIAPQKVVFSNAEQSPKEINLPDGSLVTLASGAEISILEDFAGDLRAVDLTGEAYFEVQKNPAKPFVVRSAGSEARVLGTAFEVSTLNGFEVKVAEGTVKLTAPQKAESAGESVLLTAGKSARYDPEAKAISEVSALDPNELFWKTQRLVYSGIPLKTVAEDLRQSYGVDIRIEQESAANCKLSASFFQEDINSILEIISESLNLTVTQDGESFTLSGTGC